MLPDEVNEQPRRAPGRRIAYLVSQYPALSHTFIEREIQALRERGYEIHTFSVRPCPADELRSKSMAAEFAQTIVLVDGNRAGYARGQLGLARRAPRAWLATLGQAWCTGERTGRARFYQSFYFAEAVLLMIHLRRLGLTHIHVHFANVAADVARLSVHLGRLMDGPDAGWTWSMTMHGPTEFEAVERLDLAGKVRSASSVACISDFCRSQLMRLVEPSHWDKMRVVRMSVDPGAFPPPTEGRTRREGAPLRILTVGRLVPEKGSPILIEAVELLRRRGVPVEARVVGAGPLRGALQARIDRLGLRDLVGLVGPVGQDDILHWYHWADVFCLPSFQEGLPVVLMEAMATELPVVTTRIAGIPELVADPKMGRVVVPGRADIMADALAAQACDAQERNRQGRAGRSAVLAGYRPEQTAAAMVRLFEQLAQPRS